MSDDIASVIYKCAWSLMPEPGVKEIRIGREVFDEIVEMMAEAHRPSAHVAVLAAEHEGFRRVLDEHASVMVREMWDAWGKGGMLWGFPCVHVEDLHGFEVVPQGG